MADPSSGSTSAHTRLRLWPATLAALLMIVGWYVLPLALPEAGPVGMLSAVVCSLLILIWWTFLSRAPWSERIGALLLMLVAWFATWALVHESIRGGMMGLMFGIYGVPTLCFALAVWALAARRFTGLPRRAALVLAILLTCGLWLLARTDGITGDGVSQWAWRWERTPEEKLLAQGPEDPPATAPAARLPDTAAVPPAAVTGPSAAAAAATPAPAPATAAASPAPATGSPAPPPSGASAATAAPPAVVVRAEWPGFRGPKRDGVVPGVRIDTAWTTSPPRELWRRPIGPAWSSFAVRGEVFYTQEQRGEEEVVSCYRLRTGEPVWRHRDGVRFWESNGGPGPRATPTVHDGRIYTMGATGIVNALDASTGTAVWSRNAATDTRQEVPGWGFAGSPLVVDDLVIVAAAGQLVAYDAATGAPRWVGPAGGAGYSSPHLVTIDGVRQVLLLRGSRSTSVAPADGAVLWEHTGQPGVSIVQPAFTSDGNLLIAPGDGMGGSGLRRVAVARAASGWTVQERWTSRGLKPYFSDFVVHEGHAYGFDGGILACIDLADGRRTWKGGRYGSGQLILLPDQDLLLVLSEEGELALVGAAPDRFTEIARIPALEGKTWNHPALAGETLLVRNGQEMVAFRLPPASR